jgi:hypothetical protein
MNNESRVEVDTSDLERGVRQLAAGLERQTAPVATGEATVVAGRIRNKTPTLTGRLRSTIRTSSTLNGAAVHYGGNLPYANYIDKRTDATDAATSPAAAAEFLTAMRTMAANEIRKL